MTPVIDQRHIAGANLDNVRQGEIKRGVLCVQTSKIKPILNASGINAHLFSRYEQGKVARRQVRYGEKYRLHRDLHKGLSPAWSTF